jgi:hypothetical protein
LPSFKVTNTITNTITQCHTAHTVNRSGGFVKREIIYWCKMKIGVQVQIGHRAALSRVALSLKFVSDATFTSLGLSGSRTNGLLKKN